MIRLTDVEYRYAPMVPALQSASVEFESGSLTAIIGPNGAGKSTLARLMMGLLLPSSGVVQVDGLDTRYTDPKDIRSRVGLAWQNPDNQMVCGVVEDDLAFGPENLGLPPREVQQRVDEVMGWLSLDGLRDKSVHVLSSAQRQVLAVAGAMAIRPRYLILDEVTARLDPAAAHTFLDALVDWARSSGTGLIMITHLMSEVLRAERVVRLDSATGGGGRIAQVSSPHDVLRDVRSAADVKIETPLYDILSRVAELGVRLEGTPETVEELAAMLCR